MKIVFSADDFGLSNTTNKAIIDCYKKGVVRSTSFFSDSHFYPEIINDLSFGLHINLTDRPNKKNYNYIELLLCSFNKKLLKSIEKDIDSQFSQVLSEKINIDHVDSERHVHMIPSIFFIVCKIAQKYKVKYLRNINEPLVMPSNPLKFLSMVTNLGIFKLLLMKYFSRKNKKILKNFKLKTVDYTYGLLYTNRITVGVIKSMIRDAIKRKAKVIEIITHPGYKYTEPEKGLSDRLLKYSSHSNRIKEAKILQSKKLINFLYKSKVKLVTFQGI